MLQSLETFVLDATALVFLEKVQIQLARRLLGSAGFVFRDGVINSRISAQDVRDKLQLPTVRSALALRRLRWLRKVVLRELRTGAPSLQMASLLGKFDWNA